MREKNIINLLMKSIIDAPVDKKNQKILWWMTVAFAILSIIPIFFIYYNMKLTLENKVFNILGFIPFFLSAIIIGIEFMKTKYNKKVHKSLYYIQAISMLIFLVLAIIIFSPLILINFVIDNKNNRIVKIIGFIIKIFIFVIIFSITILFLSKLIKKEFYEWRNLIMLCTFFLPFIVTILFNAKIFRISVKESLKEMTLIFLILTVGLMFYDYIIPKSLSVLIPIYSFSQEIELSKLLNLISFILATIGLWGM